MITEIVLTVNTAVYRVGSATVPSSELRAIVASSDMIPRVDKVNVHDCSVSWLSP